MPKKTIEEICVDKITIGIKKIMGKSKTPKEANLSKTFERLKKLNLPMFHDLMNNYKAVIYGEPKNI